MDAQKLFQPIQLYKLYTILCLSCWKLIRCQEIAVKTNYSNIDCEMNVIYFSLI